jgi:hypothetical protein
MAQQIQFRRGTVAQWSSANPTLAQGELGLETDSGFYKIGDGLTAWNSLAYGGLTGSNTITVATMSAQADPSAPAPDNLKFYAKNVSGRMLPKIIGPSGLNTPLQPSFFQNNITMINTLATTALGTFGQTITTVGTISHPTPTEQYGYMANIAGAGTAGITNGTGMSATSLFIGSGAGANGFFVFGRIAFPDASYNQSGASTGSRIFAGVTSVTMAAQVASDNIAGSFAGFARNHSDTGRQDTNWQFITKDGATQNVVDTGLIFTVQNVYDFFVYCRPQGTTINWRIDNVTDGTTAEGSTSANLPAGSTPLRAGVQMQTVNAVVRNLRLQRIYIESDR